MVSEEMNKFLIGALLHDIGKLRQRGRFSEDSGKDHSTIGYEWLSAQYGEGLIAAGARDHHGSEPETWQSNLSLIIYEADNLASSERKEYDPTLDVEQTWRQEILLASEFSRLQGPNGIGTGSVQPKYWPLESMGGWVEPQDKPEGAGPERYRVLWERFETDFQAMKRKGTHLSIDHLLLLLEKHTSFVPSITLQIRSETDQESFRKHPDVSLFDHLKVTAAAATSLYHYFRTVYSRQWGERVLKEEITRDWAIETEKPFLLVGGDLSGVQNFIYTVSSKGALKSLKGRSFYLELLTEYVVDRILEEGQLSRCSVLFTGGGHFHILGVNTEQFLEAMMRVRNEVNAYLFEAFNGELYQCLECVPMGKAGFKDATPLWAELAEKLDAEKKRKWEDCLDLFLRQPMMPSKDCLTRSCEVCGREDQPLFGEGVQMCASCSQQFNFGETFQRACRDTHGTNKGIGIVVWDSDVGSFKPCLALGSQTQRRVYEVFPFDGVTPERDGFLFRYRINDWAVADYGKRDRPLLAGIYHLAEFEDLESLVKNGFGMERAAVLRMDVDHLGRIFRTGLVEGDRSFSRVASLSRQLSLFFKHHVSGLLRANPKDGYEIVERTDSGGRDKTGAKRGRGLSLVYAGGDDLFIIGHWLDCLEAAFDINNAFLRFTGNPSVTLSAGLALGAASYPVYRFAKDSGKALSDAKDNGRNALGFFGQVLGWNEANEVMGIVQNEILPLLFPRANFLEVPPGSFAKGFLYRLLALLRSQKKEKIWVLPKMAYLAGRNGPSLGFLEKNAKAREAWISFRDRLFSLLQEKSAQKLEAAIIWAIMMMRKGGEA